MARRKNTNPIQIYCLVDARPETIAAGFPGGRPFYVGKTVQGLDVRLVGHKNDAKRYTSRNVGNMVLACGECLQIYLLETLPWNFDWPPREKFWIAHVRAINPDCCNISDGGFGMAGIIPSEETRYKRSVALTGKKRTPEQIERLRKIITGRIMSPEARAKISAFQKGRTKSAETKERLRLAHLGKKHTPETRVKMSEFQKKRIRKPLSEETKRKIGNANRGHVMSTEQRQQISKCHKGKTLSKEHKLRISTGNKRAYAEGRRLPPNRKRNQGLTLVSNFYPAP